MPATSPGLGSSAHGYFADSASRAVRLLFCTVLLGAPFSSARTALLPDVLPGDKFVLGSAIGNMTYQTSQVLGFIAGAAVVVVINPHRTLALDAVTFALSA